MKIRKGSAVEGTEGMTSRLPGKSPGKGSNLRRRYAGAVQAPTATSGASGNGEQAGDSAYMFRSDGKTSVQSLAEHVEEKQGMAIESSEAAQQPQGASPASSQATSSDRSSAGGLMLVAAPSGQGDHDLDEEQAQNLPQTVTGGGRAPGMGGLDLDDD